MTTCDQCGSDCKCGRNIRKRERAHKHYSHVLKDTVYDWDENERKRIKRGDD